jgi:adenosylcobinamide-GDP ribazoletransferase
MREAIGLLTTFGRRGAGLSSRAFAWFPVIGGALGALLGACWWLGDRFWAAPVGAAVVVVADLAVTGMLHFDGLADSADGLLPHATRERRLEIMRTPEIGAFAMVAVAAALVLRTTALASRAPSVLLLVGVWAGARALVAAVPGFVPYARDTGIASSMLEDAPRWPVLTLPIAGAVAALGTGLAGAFAVGIGLVAGVGVLGLAWRRLGGFTGDVLGATIVVTETVALVVAAGRW